MRFKVFGPFDIPIHHGDDKWLDKKDIEQLWNQVKGEDERLLSACGVYLFGVRGVEGKRKLVGKTLPWYVGKAERQSFTGECFNDRNQLTLNYITFRKYEGKGTPFLYLLARLEDQDSFSKETKHEYPGVRFVEELLIQMSLAINPELANTQLTSDMKTTSIPGVLNPGKRGRMSNSVVEFRRLLEIGDPIKVVGEEQKTEYDIIGPFDIPIRAKNPKIIDFEDVDQMWDNIRREDHRLLDACGLYVVGIRNRYKGEVNVRPWYIGTASKRSFKQQFLKQDLDVINEEIVRRRGEPLVFLLPRLRSKNGFSSPTKNVPRDIEFVRKVLVRYGSKANSEIHCDDHQDSKMLKELKVEGLINADPGQPRKAVTELKKLLAATSDKAPERRQPTAP